MTVLLFILFHWLTKSFPLVRYSVSLLTSVSACGATVVVRSFNSPNAASQLFSSEIISQVVSTISPIISFPVIHSIVPVTSSLTACIGVSLPLNILANSIGYMVLRIKNVVNPNATKSTTKSNTLTPVVLFCGMLVCMIACTGI